MHSQFIDPATGEAYTWEANHQGVETAARARTIDTTQPTAAGWTQVAPVRQQGDDSPELHRLTGTILSASQHEAFLRFWRICATQTIHFLPCYGGRYEVVVRAYDVTRKRVVRSPRGSLPHVWTYTLELEVVTQIA